jgi:hypothetical protein
MGYLKLKAKTKLDDMQLDKRGRNLIRYSFTLSPIIGFNSTIFLAIL